MLADDLSRLLIVSVSVLVVLAAACTAPLREEDTFAERVCSTTLPRANETLDVLDDAIDTRAAPGLGAWASLVGLADRSTEIARRFHVEMIGVPADTDAERRAKVYVAASARLAFARMTDEKRRARRLPQSLTLLQSIQALERLERTLGEVLGMMTGAKGLATTQVPELASAFADSDSCKKLDALIAEKR